MPVPLAHHGVWMKHTSEFEDDGHTSTMLLINGDVLLTSY